MRILRYLALIALGLYLLTGVVQVRRGERGVVRRFGRILEQQPEPGLWIGLPWGMDRVDRVEVDSVRSVEVGYRADTSDGDTMPAGQLLTGDHNLVNVQVVLFYKVRPERVVDFVLQQDRVPAMLERAVEAGVAAWVAGRDVDEVLLRGKNGLRQALLDEVRATIEPYAPGVQILDARVARVAPPDEVKDAFDGVVRAQTQMATLRFRAEQESASRQRQARAERYRIEQTTRAYVHDRTVIARQEARRFTQRSRQYQAARETNPDYLRQIWQEERGQLFAKMKAGGQIDLLDHHLSGGGLDIVTTARPPGRR